MSHLMGSIRRNHNDDVRYGSILGAHYPGRDLAGVGAAGQPPGVFRQRKPHSPPDSRPALCARGDQPGGVRSDSDRPVPLAGDVPQDQGYRLEKMTMKRVGWIILAVIAALALLLGGFWLGYAGNGSGTAASGYGPWGMMGGRHMMGGYWGSPMMGWAGGLGMLLFWALVIGGIVWLIVTVSRNQSQINIPRPASETALDILKRRYAAGEINKEQFDEMRRNLEA